jgi:vanillate O-demethylase ferredoxin subunit
MQAASSRAASSNVYWLKNANSPITTGIVSYNQESIMNTSSLTVRVTRKWMEAQGICAIEMMAVPGQVLPSFSAGSHIDVHVPGGFIRPYSLCNDPSEEHRYVIGVLRDPASRGGSVAVHDQVKAGQNLQISAPKNHFALSHEASSHLLLAGGIGITPILCMAERLANIGADFELHYCTRNRHKTAFLDRINESAFASQVELHFDDGVPEQKIDLAKLLVKPEPGRHVYVCGPKGFMDAALGLARVNGWPPEQLHCEVFNADIAATAQDAGFEVQIASTGHLLQVPAQVSVLKALAAHGIEIPFACEQGVCGTCLTRVISGTPDHRDQYLTSEEQAVGDQFMPCCSRAKTPRLVLDL